MVGLQSSRVGSKPFMIFYFLLDATFRLIHSRQILIATEKLTLLPRLSLPFQQISHDHSGCGTFRNRDLQFLLLIQ